MKNKKTDDVKKDPITPETPSPLETSSDSKPSFPIVGIGASAGGLAAFEAFFAGMPTDYEPGMAFVLVQHLAPDHKSILAELISRYTKMQVFEVEDGITVKPNCTYIIPPGYDMAFLNGTLQLFEHSEPRGLRLPIDFFFRSLAQDQGDRAIGIILSGTGSDGSMGVRAIKGEGGMVMAQIPESTEYDGMPRSAIATGLVDYELSPGDMAPVLISYSSRAYKKEKILDTIDTPKFENIIKKIFIIVRSHTGHDFSSYKSNSTQRRIERRMAVHQIDTIEKYLKYLEQSNEEIDSLFKDLLIGVTNFFRDIDSFNSLNETVIPKLFAGKKPGSLIRVWSAGCSTGEEAYSIAILLKEHLDSLDHSFTVQVFATDIDPHAIASARAGIYPASIALDISPEHLERYFISETSSPDSVVDTYRINKSIRDMLIFSEHNIIKDPPFSKLDLICCRNLMIYLNIELQKKLFPVFHYALNPNGFIFLGSSESLGEFTDLFQSIDSKSKLYLRKDNALGAGRSHAGGFFMPNTHSQTASPASLSKKSLKDKASPRVLAEQTLLKYLAPPSALVNGKGDIYYLHNRTGMYLEPAVGEVEGYNIINMAREGLRHQLSASLRKAVQSKSLVRCQNLKVKTNGSFTTVNLAICPAVRSEDITPSDQKFLVILEEVNQSGAGQTALQTVDSPGTIEENIVNNNLDDLVATLKDELREKEEYLQATIEELETSNEEFKSTNEEMQSINEEMQSANEELETSKEELQSVNEEVSTVNNELSSKVSELTRANNDFINLLSGTGIATIFVNHQQQILNFTPTASELINLIKSDIGRPVNHILTNLSGYSSLSADIQSVLDTLIPKTIEVQTVTGDWFRLSISPYRTIQNVIEGAVLTFVHITVLKQYQEKLQIEIKEKMNLLKEVHHRVKNNIGNIEGLLTLQINNSTNVDLKSELQSTISRVQSMRILYDKLLISEDYREISLKNYIESLIDSITVVFSASGNITIENQITDFILNSKTITLIGIALNEILTNAFKYAFTGRDSGHISVIISKVEKHITLTVQDNGVGMGDDFEFNKISGFGITIIKMLVQQLKGTYSIVNENGTKSVIQFEI